MQAIEFFEQYEWEEARRAILFWAKVGEKTVACRVTEAALRAISGETDSDVPGTDLFPEHIEAVHAVATRMLRDERFDEQGDLTIDQSDCESAG